ARCSNLSRPPAPRARHIKAHLAGRLLNRSAAITNRASLRRADRAGSMAGLASVQPRDLQLLHRPAHCIPEINLDLILKVAAGFLLRLDNTAAPATASEKLTEQIAEAARASAFASRAAKVESAKVKIHRGVVIASAMRRRRARIEIVAVEPVLIVHLPLLGIGEDVVRFLQLLEFFFRGFVPRIQVRVIFAVQFAKG